jgi:hypothetical protein
MSKPVDQNRMEQALQYLTDTDERCAALKSDVERMDYRADAIFDAILLRSDGSVAVKEALAGTHPEYVAAKEKYFDALKEHEAMRNLRPVQAYWLHDSPYLRQKNHET